MSRYIDYDALDYKNWHMIGKSSDFIDGVVYMAQRIEDAPSIDIVRCTECKYGEYREDHDEYLCRDDGVCVHDAEWFCADGEREGE